MRGTSVRYFHLREPLEGDGSCRRGIDHVHQSGLETDQNIGDRKWDGLHSSLIEMALDIGESSQIHTFAFLRSATLAMGP